MEIKGKDQDVSRHIRKVSAAEREGGGDWQGWLTVSVLVRREISSVDESVRQGAL